MQTFHICFLNYRRWGHLNGRDLFETCHRGQQSETTSPADIPICQLINANGTMRFPGPQPFASCTWHSTFRWAYEGLIV